MCRFVSSIWIGMIALCAIGVAAQAPQQAPAVAPQQQPAQAAEQGPGGIDVITMYCGTWKVQGEHFATAYSQVGKEEETLRNDCW